MGSAINNSPRVEKEIGLSVNATKVLSKRYLKRDTEGNPTESPADMFWRVASNIAGAEKLFGATDEQVQATTAEFFDLMASLDFLPNSPTLMNAGRELQQLSACFVLPVEDSMESIFEAIRDAALIHKSGGGTGFSFSRLRPVGDSVKSTLGVSSGPVSFMKVFNSATEAVKQGGTRRGANMGILRVDHPDIMEFIRCKKDNTSLQNFNISVALTEDFMEAVESGDDYELISPKDSSVVGKMSARKVFDEIVNGAWATGDPGIVFIDRINRENPTPAVGDIESTNPCGEQPLLPYEACNLGSINLSNMVSGRPGAVDVDYGRMSEAIHKAVRFLDDVIEVNCFPLPRIEELAKANRKIGLGVMGWSDMLIKLGIAYDSQAAVDLGRKVMKFINDEGHKASSTLATKRGAFPNFEKSVYGVAGAAPLRNATVTTIAPTGTLSIIANCSSGIEPLFALSYIRNVMDNNELVESNYLFEAQAKARGFYNDELVREVASHGSVKGMDQVPADVQEVFVTAHDISPEWHVRMQGAFQEFTDNAVSKTVNFATDAIPEDVENVYNLAWKLGCKGVTIYRDGSKDKQVLNIQKDSAEQVDLLSGGIAPRPRAEVTVGRTMRIVTGCGNLYVTVNEDEFGMCEVFTQVGKSGGCAASQSEGIGRLISLSLRAGVKTEAIIKHLRGIRCSSPAWQKGGNVLSCPDAIAIAMEKYLGIREAAEQRADAGANFSSAVSVAVFEKPAKAEASVYKMGACPDCGGVIEQESGCMVCRACGFSKCG